ncbi:hypothetical protein LJC11_05795, partial [Bacteroidales bacterium OttesenSCG-928-I21]|nr:hypothetical protein [Bacteroidales bacterium OttesenSCG-928-I21]
MKKYIISLSLIFLFINGAIAENVQLLTRPAKQDSIMLRWAPTDKEVWSLGNQYGYVVERYTILRQGKQPSETERLQLTPEPLKPAPVEQWEKYEDDKFVVTAAECIFGEREPLPAVSPVAIAKQFQAEQNRFSFALYAVDQSVTAARLSGLYWVDKTAKANEKYLYTVHIALPDSLPNDTAFSFTGLSEHQPLTKPAKPTARWDNKKVFLSWEIFYLSHIYNTYIVEKSSDGNKYTRLSENAMVQLADPGISPEYAFWSDSLPDNNSKWHYRVRGINAFGETGPPSDAVVGQGTLPILSAPTVTNKEVIDNKEVRLSWEYPEEMNEYITGFRLYRSNAPDGKKEKIHEITNGSVRTFTDKKPGLTNYYVLSVFNNSTEKFTPGHTYAELIDSIPPAPPVGLSGSIDSTGVVSLWWQKNTDSDINGYRVYRSNHPDFEFLLISPELVSDTYFTDSIQLKTLTKNVYYRIRAIDLRQNQSEFGSILELKRPDVIPPVSPVVQRIEEQKNGLLITWTNSSSADVVSHQIYRKASDESVFQLVANVDKKNENQSSYLD